MKDPIQSAIDAHLRSVSGGPRRTYRYGAGDEEQVRREQTATETLLPGLFRDKEAYDVYEQTLREKKVDAADGFFGNLVAGFAQSTDDLFIQLGQNGFNFTGLEGEEAEAYFMARQQASTSASGTDFSEQTGFTLGQMASEVGGSAAAGAAIGSIIPGVGTVIGAKIGGLVGLGRLFLRSYDNGYYESMHDQAVANQARLRRGQEALEFDSFEANTRGFSMAATEIVLEKTGGKFAKGIGGRLVGKADDAGRLSLTLDKLENLQSLRGLKGRSISALTTVGGGALAEGSQELSAEVVNMGVGQLQDMIAGRASDIDRFQGMDTIQGAARSFAIGAIAGGTVKGGTAVFDSAIQELQVRGGAKRVMPEVAQRLNEANLGGDRSMLGLFTNKDDAARAEELTERRKNRKELEEARDAAQAEAERRQKLANRKDISEDTKAGHLAAADEAIAEAEKINMDLQEHTRVLELLETVDEQAREGVKVRDMVDGEGNKIMSVGRKTPDQVLKKYGGKPRSKVDGEGDFTPARRVKKNEQTESETKTAARLKKLGATNVVFFEGGEGSSLGGNPAFYTNESAGTIYIRRMPQTGKRSRTNETLMFAYGLHEIIHMVQHLDPALYKEIRGLMGDLNVYKGFRRYTRTEMAQAEAAEALDPAERPVRGALDAAAAGVLTRVESQKPAEAKEGETVLFGTPATPEAGVLVGEAVSARVELEGSAQTVEEGAAALEGPISQRLAALGLLGPEAKMATKVIAALEAANTDKRSGIAGRAALSKDAGTTIQDVAAAGPALEARLEAARAAAGTSPDSTPATPSDPATEPTADGPMFARDRKAKPRGYGKAPSNVTVHDVREQVPESSRTGGSPVNLNPGEPLRMASGNSFATFDENEPEDIERVRATRIDYGVSLTQDRVDGLMSQAEDRLRERHGEDAVDRAKSSIALKVKGKPEADFDIGSTRTGIRPDARGVMTEAEYQAAVAANPPQPDVSEDDNKIIRHTVTYSADGSYRTPNANFVNTAINGSWAQRFWYEAFGQDLVRAFPFMEGAPSLSAVVSQFISATSPRTPVRENLRRALGLIAAHIAGRPTNVSVMEPKGVLEAEAGEYGDAPGQFKVGSFNNTLALGMGTADSVPLPTLDVIMARFFGIPQEAFADPLVYELMSDFLGLVAQDVNGQASQTQQAADARAKLARGEDLTPQEAMAVEPFRPWQLQAVMWSTRGDDTGTFSESLDEFLEQAYEAGLATKVDGVLTMNKDAFLDPKVEDILDAAAFLRGEGSGKATVEVATEATVEGRRANNIGKFLLGIAVNPNSSPEIRTLSRKLLAELYGPNNAFLATLSATRTDMTAQQMLDAALQIDNAAFMLEVVIDPSGTGLVRGTTNSTNRSALSKGPVEVGSGGRKTTVTPGRTKNQTLVQEHAGASLNKSVTPSMALSASATSLTHMRTTSPGQAQVGTGLDGGVVVNGPLGAYPDTEGNLILNNVVNVVVPGGSVSDAVDAVSFLSVSLGQEAAASHRLTDVDGAPDGLGVTVVFTRGHVVTNVEVAAIQQGISNPNVTPLVQPVSNGTLIIFANFNDFAETDQQTNTEIETAVGRVLPTVQAVINTPADGVRLDSDFRYVFGDSWNNLYPDGQTAPTESDITRAEDEIILKAAKDEIASGTFFDGIPTGEMESDEAFAKRQAKLKTAKEKAESKRDRVDTQYDNAILRRNKARDAGKDTTDLDAKVDQKRTERRLARQDAAKARDDYDNARPEPKRFRALSKGQRELILRIAPTESEQLALIAPAAYSRLLQEDSTGSKIVRKVYGRLAKLPKDEQARAAKAIGGSQAFRLHHLRHSTQAHRADFRTRQQEANDSVAKRIKKDFPGNPQFARRRRPSVRVGELSVHVVPADSEGFGNGVDVEQRTNEHQLMMRVNDNATKVLDKLISSGKVDDLGAHFGTTPVNSVSSEQLAHTLMINANDYGWSKIKKATTVGEALHVVAAMNPEDSVKARMNRLRELVPEMADDIAVIEGAALRIVRSQGGRNEASKALANHLIDLGMDLDMPIDTQQRGSFMGVFVPPMRDTQADTAASQPRPAVGKKRSAQALMPNAVNGSLPDNWVEKGCLCIGPSGYFAPKAELYGAGAAYGVDAVGGVETLLHEVVHARTNLAIRDELARVLGGYKSKTRMDMSSLDQRFESQAGDARQASDESAAAVYLDRDPSDTVPWMRAICEAYLDALVYHRSPDFDNGGVGDYNVSNLDEFVAHAMTDRDTQDFLARVPSSLVAKDQQGLVPEMQSALQVQLSAIEELLRLPEDSLTTNHGSQLSVLEVALSGAYRVLKNQPQDSVAVREQRAVAVNTDPDVSPLVFARSRKGQKKTPMTKSARERAAIEARMGKKRGAGAFKTALDVIMDRERQRLAAREGTRPDIAALRGLEEGSKIQAEIARADKEAALRDQMRKMSRREADLKAKRVRLADAKRETLKFIEENLDKESRPRFTKRLINAQTEAALLKLEREVLRRALVDHHANKVNRFEKRMKKLLNRSTKMDDDTRTGIKTIYASGRLPSGRKGKLPKTDQEVSEMVENAQILDELLNQAEVLYRDDRIAMEEAKSEQIATIERGQSLVENAVSGRSDRERTATGEVTTSMFMTFQRGGLDLQSTLKILGLGGAWNALTRAESRMLKARRDHMEKLDAAVRRAGFRDLADFRARASNTRGRINTEKHTVRLGGKNYEITLGQFLKLLAMDNETLDIIGRRGKLSLRVGDKGSAIPASGPDLISDIFAIREAAPPHLKQLVADMKDAREQDLRNPAMAALFRITGNVPPMVAGYEPRTSEVTTRITSLEEIEQKGRGGVATIFAENAGFTKQRSASGSIVVSDFAGDYFDHMDKSLELGYMAEDVRILWSTVTRPEVRQLITRKFGSESYDRMLKHVGYATRVLPAVSDPSLGFVSTVVGGILVMSPPTWGRILFGGLNTLQTEYSSKEVAGALKQVMGMVAGRTFGGFFQDQVSKKSGYLWDRDSSNAVDRRVVFSRDDGSAGIADIAQLHNVVGDTFRNIIASGQAAMSGDMGRSIEHLNQARRSLAGLPRAIPTLRLLDRIIVATAVQAEMNKRGEREASPDSILAAETAIRRTQNTSSPLDDSNVTAKLRTDGGYLSSLLAFTSDPMKTYSRLYEPGSKLASGDTAKKAAVFIGGNAAVNVSVTYLWNMLLASVIGDEDEKKEVLAELHKQKATDRVLDMFIEEGIVRASPFPLLSFLTSREVASIIAETIEASNENRPVDYGRTTDYLSDSLIPVGVDTVVNIGEGFFKLAGEDDPDRAAEIRERLFTDIALLGGLPISQPFKVLEAAFTDASPAELRSAEYQLRKMMNISAESGNEFSDEFKAVFREARQEGARKREERKAARAR